MADHVIDYTKEDFTKGDQRYDVIFDNVQNHTFSERRRVLTSNGICVLAGLGGAGWHEDTWNAFGPVVYNAADVEVHQPKVQFLHLRN